MHWILINGGSIPDTVPVYLGGPWQIWAKQKCPKSVIAKQLDSPYSTFLFRFVDHPVLDQLRGSLSLGHMPLELLIPDKAVAREIINRGISLSEIENWVERDDLQLIPLPQVIAMFYIQNDPRFGAIREDAEQRKMLMSIMKKEWGYKGGLDLMELLDRPPTWVTLLDMVSLIWHAMRTAEDTSWVLNSEIITDAIIAQLFPGVVFVGPPPPPDDVRPFSAGNVLFTFLAQSEMPRPIWKGSFVANANEFSFLLRVTHVQHFLSFLFPGDAEGITLERVIGRRNQKKALLALIQEIPDGARRFYPEIEAICGENEADEDNELHLKNRKSLTGIGVAMIPHHGSETRGSLRIVSYLINKRFPPAAFVASSTVMPMDRLPRRSSWETIGREIEHPAHLAVYGSGANKMVRQTRKDFYVSESAPGCCYWFMTDGSVLSMYNAYRDIINDPRTDIGFFPISVMTDLPTEYVIRRLQQLGCLYRNLFHARGPGHCANWLTDSQMGLLSVVMRVECGDDDSLSSILAVILPVIRAETMYGYQKRIQQQAVVLRHIAENVTDGQHCRGPQMFEFSRRLRIDPELARHYLEKENRGDLFGGIGIDRLVSDHVIRLSRPFYIHKTQNRNSKREPAFHYPMCYGSERQELLYEQGVSFPGFPFFE
jgi:hypothetical protein